MKIIDYNGEDRWSKVSIIDRYSRYCRELKVPNPQDLSPVEHTDSETKWVYPVMDKVIEGIERGDAACRRIGIEFIEEDRKFTFGKTLKSNTARALRRSDLAPEEQDRIRRRWIDMLLAGNVPHEYKQYAKLLKRIGLGPLRDEIELRVDRANQFVMRYYDYLTAAEQPVAAERR
jgi:hypothetical protein